MTPYSALVGQERSQQGYSTFNVVNKSQKRIKFHVNGHRACGVHAQT